MKHRYVFPGEIAVIKQDVYPRHPTGHHSMDPFFPKGAIVLIIAAEKMFLDDDERDLLILGDDATMGWVVQYYLDLERIP